MSKQTKTYLLLTVVLVIWGLIGFKVAKAISPDEKVPPVQPMTAMVPKATIKKDTFTLWANYRDPFLGTLPKAKRPKKSVARAKPKKGMPQRNIAYAGSVAEQGTTNRMFFVTIDGQQHIMSKNEVVKEVRLISGTAESIKVRYNGSTKTILLN
ncbi:MAG: hypothetical protein AAGA86_14645 [Bacteroidota bacterium]